MPWGLCPCRDVFMPFDGATAARKNEATPGVGSVQSQRSDHRAPIEIGTLADDLRRTWREFEARHHAYAKGFSGRSYLAFRRPQRPEMRARKPEFNQHCVAFGADGNDLVGLIGKGYP